MVQDLEVGVYIMTHDRHLEAIVRTMLPDRVRKVEACPEQPAPKSMPWGGLLLIDSMPREGCEGLQNIMGLDRMVKRHLVDTATFTALASRDRARAIPMQWPPKKGSMTRQKCAATALAEALDEALFSRVFSQARSMNHRWKTRMEVQGTPDGNHVEAILKFSGVDKLLKAKDLKQEIGWGDVPEIRLKDVLGLEGPKERIREYLTWLKDPRGTPGLKAAVLYGPPGTGKTHLAISASGEAGVHCIFVSGSTFHAKYIGETERLIRETLAAAEKYSEAVVVIDELDALAWSREQTNDWMAQTQSSIMGALLTSIDKLRKGPGRVVLLCTSNQIQKVDLALLRRMDRIRVGLPDPGDRQVILKGLLGQDALGEEFLNELATITAGLTPSNLVNLVEDAQKIAGIAGTNLSMEHIRHAIFQARRGEINTSIHLSDDDRKRVAYHESAHALLAHDLLGPDSLAHLSVIPTTDGSLGAAYLSRPDSVGCIDRVRLKSHLTVLLGGKAAEASLYPRAGAGGGVSSDLAEATRLASQAIMAWGMDDTLPPLAVEQLPLTLQNVVARQFVDRIQAWIAEAEREAVEHLGRNQNRLDCLAEGLLQAETLHRPAILALLAMGTASDKK
jgi:ATP-dependent Zn protease